MAEEEQEGPAKVTAPASEEEEAKVDEEVGAYKAYSADSTHSSRFSVAILSRGFQ